MHVEYFSYKQHRMANFLYVQYGTYGICSAMYGTV